MTKQTREDRIARGLYWQKAWSLIGGCSKVSPGCDNCWAEKEAHMRKSNPNEKVAARYKGLTDEGKFNGKIMIHSENLALPINTKKPIVWAIWNDLLHEEVEPIFFAIVMRIIMDCPQHTFLILTKRPERMVNDHLKNTMITHFFENPLSNLWWGVTAENQEQADKRIPILLQIPAAVRFVSVEPMLGPVDLDCYPSTGCPTGWLDEECSIDWVICGGESGHGARPMHPDWTRDLRDQCQTAGVPYFFKQWGEWSPIEAHTNPFDTYTSKEFRFIDCFGQNVTNEPIIDLPPRVAGMMCVGKKNAGRLLDGKEYSEFPEVMINANIPSND